MSEREIAARTALAVFLAKIGAVVRFADVPGVVGAGETAAMLLEAMSGAMWRGATAEELLALLSTSHPAHGPDPIEDIPTPTEAPHAKRPSRPPG